MSSLAQTKIPPNIDMPLHVAGLSQIPMGEYSLGVPVKDERVQVGFRGTPDRFDRLVLSVGMGTIRIAREGGGDIQIESSVLNKGHAGDRTIRRTQVLVEPEPEIILNESDGEWATDGTKVASRVGLVRFSAKLAEVAIGKAKKAQLQN